MMQIKPINLVAISYYCCCCCWLISCATSGNFGSEAASSTSGNANSQSAESQQAEIESLAKVLFMTREEFDQERPRLLGTSEVRPLLDQFANLQELIIARQTDSELQISEQTDQNQQEQPQNRWTNLASRFMVKALREFVNLAEDENEEKIVTNCESMVIMKNLDETRSLIAQRFPILSKFAEENYERMIEKCVYLLKSRFELFLSLLKDKQRFEGRNFGNQIGLTINKLQLFGSLEDEMLKHMGIAEAAARYVETFGGPGTIRRDVNMSEVAFKKHFMDRTQSIMNSLCENILQHVRDIFLDTINVLMQIEPVKLESLSRFGEYNDWLSVATACEFWTNIMSPEIVYNAHVSFHMNSENLKHLKSLSDALFSPSASRISDANEFESRLKLLRNELVFKATFENDMFRLNVREMNVLLAIKDRISEETQDKENGGQHDSDLMQQIEAFIKYYESIEAHNIVLYLNALINLLPADSMREMETILRAGNEELANYPQINENLRELRRFVQGSNNIGGRFTGSDILTGLTDYFLNNLRNLEQISDVNDYESRKDLVTRWFNQFMVDNCEKYKDTFGGLLPIYNKVRSERTLSRFDDELTLTIFNVNLCSNMDNNILIHIDVLTRLISSRVDGGGPSD